MQTAELQQRWRRLWPQLDSNTVTKEWQCIESRYSEAHRHYHTLHHIAACLRWLDQVRVHIGDPRAVELALWFHDVVYNPRRQDNENISAEYAVSTLSLLKEPKAQREAVRDLILVTRHPSHPGTDDQRWMVDIDLTILGAEPAVYDAYAARVRQEYMHVPDPVYGMGRRAVLEGFLQEGIYHTAHFRTALEERARHNLEREMGRL